MATGRKAYWDVQAPENEVKLCTYEFMTNSTSAPDGVSNSLTSATRSAAGKFTLVFKRDFPDCLFMKAAITGAAGYDISLTEQTTGSTGNITGCKVEVWSNGVLAAATGTITCDTKANTTQADHFFLNDGQRIYGFELDVAGTGAQYAVDGVAATGTITCDTKANTTQGDYIVLNDGQQRYGFELDVAGTGALRSASGVAATGTITCDTKANTTDDDFFLLNDGQNIWAVVLDVAGDSSALANGTDYFVDDGCELVVDISGATTAADVSALLYAAINGTSIQITAADGTGTVTLTNDGVGPVGNTQQSGLGTLHNAWAVTDMTGGTDPVTGVDVWTNLDISGATTAADISALLYASINGTDIQMTAADGSGTVTLTHDEKGLHGNAQQYEQASNSWAITDMTGGTDPMPCDTWTNVDISGDTTAADISATLFAAINGTDIQMTAADGTGSVTLTADDAGAHGNTQQSGYGTLHNAWAVTDMTGGSSGTQAAADTNDYQVQVFAVMRQSKLTFR